MLQKRFNPLFVSQKMKYPEGADKEFCELLDELSKVMVPASKRKPVYRTNFHVPYYKPSRMVRVI